MITKDLGAVTAYAYAVEGGYTGTEQEFTQLMADLGITVDEFEHFSVSVSTLPAGSSATASYSNGVLSLGIPKGDKGDTGNTGATGATPQLSIGTVETTAEPSVTITGTVDNPVLNFGLVKGDKGDTGEVSEAELTQAFENFAENGTVANAEQLTTDIRANDQTPYLFRTAGGSVDIGDREYINGIVGGTVAWNQMCNYENFRTNSDIPDATLTNNNDGSVTIGVPNAISSAVTVSISKNASIYYIKVPKDHKFLIYDEHPNVSGIEYRNDYNGVNLGYNTIKVQTQASGYILLALRLYNLPAGTYTLKPNIIDLTLLFGSTIADYIYSLEQANAGTGVAWFKKLFPKAYYAYNTGELMSVKALRHITRGFNAWDEEWEYGDINDATGQNDGSNTGYWRSKNYIPVLPNTTYYHMTDGYTGNFRHYFYDADKNWIKTTAPAAVSNGSTTGVAFTVPADAYYMRFRYSTSMQNYKNCINLHWDGERDGEYEPYELHSYPLDSDLTLRGIPKIENGNLYYDGDVYEADGTVTRKYRYVTGAEMTLHNTSSSGYKTYKISATDAKTAGLVLTNYTTNRQTSINSATVNEECYQYKSSGTEYLFFAINSTRDINTVSAIYELATPTTETADSYTNPQIVSDFGTEEYVIDDDVFAIPVGHNTDYPVDLKAKLEMAPNSPPGDGMYVVKQTSGTNEYVPLIIPSGIPPVPTENGSYTLTATVSGGTTTLSWS